MKMTVNEAAKLMQVTPQWIRMGLQQERLPFGSAVKMPGGRWSYYINSAKFFQYLEVDKHVGMAQDSIRQVSDGS